MADEVGVTTRTIRRDLETLRQVGFPLIEKHVSSHGRKHWQLSPGIESVPLSFTWDEAIALYLARRYLEPLANTHLWDSAQKAFRKIKSTLGEPAVRYLEKMTGAFHRTSVGSGNYSKKSEIIDQLMIGIEDRCMTFITYQSMRSTEPVKYDVYPYGIVFHRNSLYLVAHAVDHGEIRHYKIDRVEDVDVQNLKFTRPDDFDIRKHLEDSFGIYRGNGKQVTVCVRFAPEVTRYVEESHWHHSQKLTREADGGLILEVTLDALEEFKSWVMSFGRHAKVLWPRMLLDEITVELQDTLRQYER
ncbi:MAG: WYL domain-containing protein [Planctomycetaceae bacterium]